MRKVLIIDTSILCVLLKVPGKETCGSTENLWTKEKVDAVLNKEEAEKTTFVLPLAVIIETGNHISQASSKRYETAQEFAKLIKLTADNTTPWAAFTEQSHLWDAEKLKELANEFPELAKQKLSIGDATITRVADYYSRSGNIVEIVTGDEGLKAHEPSQPLPIPRRRKK